MATHKKQHQQIFLEGDTLPQQQKLPFSLDRSSDDASEQAERLDMLTRVPYKVSATYLRCTNYQVDRSIREASLAGQKQWRKEEETLVHNSSNKLKVYMCNTKENPLEIAEADKRIRELSETTALTARITLGIWNTRRANNQLAKNGSIAMRLEEVLEWRGIKKHSNRAYPGTDIRYTNGYRPQQKEQVLHDLDLLSSCWVRGNVALTFQGKKTNASVDDPYLRYSIIRHGTLIAGVFVSPGDWINTYTEQDNYFFTEIDRRIFQLNPQNEQHELRLALFLVERWRGRGKRSNNDEL